MKPVVNARYYRHSVNMPKTYKITLIVITVLVLLGISLYIFYELSAFKQTAHRGDTIAPSVKTTQILAVGDIASCSYDDDEKTAELAKSLTGKILTLGDNVYNDGTKKEFTECFDPKWGQLKNRIHPSPGNHDYRTKDASGYFEYFGDIAAPGVGYYSFEYGGWLIFSLNSNCRDVACDENSQQVKWLKEQLSTTKTTCQIAYYHHPRFSSGAHGSTEDMSAVWNTLVVGRVDIVLNGHEHLYERFAKLDKDGNPDKNGARQFTVGTGGKTFYKFSTILPGSEVRDNQNHGLIKISLETAKYSWEFIGNNNVGVLDSGKDTCN